MISSREFQFKIKGISMSTFTQEDVSALEGGGNSAANASYLARYQASRDVPIPTSSSDISKLRDFIRQKYLDKKWHTDSGSSLTSSAPSTSAATATEGSYSDSFIPPGRRASTNDFAKPKVSRSYILFYLYGIDYFM